MQPLTASIEESVAVADGVYTAKRTALGTRACVFVVAQKTKKQLAGILTENEAAPDALRARRRPVFTLSTRAEEMHASARVEEGSTPPERQSSSRARVEQNGGNKRELSSPHLTSHISRTTLARARQ